ncbi:MAG: PepSY-like domain-containing protein [Bacteroidetes bacterium]|nr:PepSY-like domain-containing protein [Bacteroidota bacterium]MBS1539631.1 PepSY-like domain-containing protein [Bacteroidota bacterium]
MKKLFLGLLLAIACTFVFGQKLSTHQVPAAVISTFNTKFPGVSKVMWEKEKINYEAGFLLDGAKTSSTFDRSGKWLETETEIKATDLPTAVHQSLKKDFADYKVNETARIERATDGLCFEAEVEKGGEKYDLLFTPDGKKLSQTKVDKED